MGVAGWEGVGGWEERVYRCVIIHVYGARGVQYREGTGGG